MLTLKSACSVAWKALHGVRGGLWVQSETFARAPRVQIRQDFVKTGSARGLRDPERKGVKAVIEVRILDRIFPRSTAARRDVAPCPFLHV